MGSVTKWYKCGGASNVKHTDEVCPKCKQGKLVYYHFQG